MSTKGQLQTFGWTQAPQQSWEAHPHADALVPARVIRHESTWLRVNTGSQTLRAAKPRAACADRRFS